MNRSIAGTSGRSPPTINVNASPTFCGAAGAADAMNVIFRMLRHVVVDHVTHVGDVDAARGDVGRDHHFIPAVAETVRAPVRVRVGAVRVQHRDGMIIALKRRAMRSAPCFVRQKINHLS